MSIALQCLLRLPAGLRRHAFQDPMSSKNTTSALDAIARRAFSNSMKTLRQQRPTLRPSKPTVPNTQPPALRPPPPKSPSLTAQPLSHAEQLLHGSEEVLLYKAPSHKSYMLTSYISGAFLIYGTYMWSRIIATPPPDFEWTGWKRFVLLVGNGIPTLFMAVMGTVLLLAPTKMVSKLSVIRALPAGGAAGRQSAPTVLRCEMKPSLPWTKPKTIEVRPSEAMLDRRVSAVDLDLTSIPISKSRAFTTSATAHPTAKRPMNFAQRGLIGRTWATFTGNIRRVFYREGICFIRFGDHGNWKLDLQHCELLDGGRPLDRLTTFDTQRGVGPVAWLKRNLGA